MVRSTHLAVGWVRRAQVLLLLSKGLSVRAIQARTGMSPRRQRHWRQQFEQRGLDGLLDAERPGRPKKFGAEKESAILAASEQSPAAPITHWSTRRLAFAWE
jgi:transposase